MPQTNRVRLVEREIKLLSKNEHGSHLELKTGRESSETCIMVRSISGGVSLVAASAMVVITLALAACATTQERTRNSEAGQLTDTVLSNVNAAPASLTPPGFNDDDPNAPADPVHRRTQADYHFTLGEALSFDGKSEKAIEEFKLALVYDPESVTVRLRLAGEYVHVGMVSEAIEQAEQAVHSKPDNIEGRMFLGGLYAGLKLYDAAKDQFQAVIHSAPDNGEAHVFLGAILAEQKDYAGALEYFRQLLKNPRFTDKSKAHFYIGKMEVELGEDHFAEAERAFETAHHLDPQDPDIALALGLLYKMEGHEDKMVSFLRGFEDRNGTDHSIAKILARYYIDHDQYDEAIGQMEVIENDDSDNLNIKVQIALLLIETHKLDAAAQKLTEILDVAPEMDKVRYYLGAVNEDLGHSGAAIEQYRQLPDSSMYYVDGTIRLAHLILESGRPAEAIETIRQAISKRDDSPQLFAYYAALLDDQKQYRQAMGMLQQVVHKFPDNVQLRFSLGSIYDRLGEREQSIAQMKIVLQIDKDNVQALNFLAYTYAELDRDLGDAERLARRALEKQPRDGYILDTVGWVLFKQGKMGEAIRYLESAFAAKSDEAVIAEHLGDAYLRYDLWQKALQMYRRAAQLETDAQKSSRIRAKLVSAESQRQNFPRTPSSLPSSDKTR